MSTGMAIRHHGRMAQWIAFILLLGIPAWWFFVGNGTRAKDTQDDQPMGFFLLASADVEIAAGPETLNEVETALDAFWAEHDQVAASVQMEVGISAAELAANIVEHGNAASIRMRINLSPCQVHVDFIDDGGPVEVDLGSVVMPGEFAERGRGLAMVKDATSRLSYERQQVGNRWTFVSKEFDRAKKVLAKQG